MQYVPIPKDLNAVKSKVIFNLTKRQLICFSAGAAVAVPLYFLCGRVMNKSAAAVIMIVALLPFMLLAMYEKNGQPLEKIVKSVAHSCFIRPKRRPYITKNFFASPMKGEKTNAARKENSPRGNDFGSGNARV